eukprot:Sspe_Gene.69630::Locus_41054_Transcript_1_3_Confidence_0.500_Length_1796::g.69630::m.69630
MAITARSPRGNLWMGSKGTGPEVGPGSYKEKEVNIKGVAHSVAPFSSSVERNTLTTQVSLQTPGPGYYDYSSGKATMTTAKGSSQFASKTTRLLSDIEIPKKALTPGPGSYEKTSSIKVVPTQPPAGPAGRQKAINWIKVATAPSIPAPSQSYGYEEGTHGELIQGRPPATGHAGKGCDTAGPGEYEPRDDVTRRKITYATDFGKCKTSRENEVPKEVAARPGPGSYDVNGGCFAKCQTTEDEAKASCVFASSTFRNFIDKRAAELPGPGTYSLKSTFESRADFLGRNQGELNQAFGTTVSTKTDRVEAQPGPGQYTVKSDFDKPKPKWEVSHGAFISTSSRFEDVKTTNKQTPGPGYYQEANERNSLVSKLHRRVAGRYGVFGSTAQRFPVQKPQITTGPGSYDPKDNVNPAEIRRRDLRTSAFVSNIDRMTKPKEETPGVGEYDTAKAITWLKPSVSQNHKNFITTEPRFKPMKPDTYTPGPGEYESQTHTVAAKVLGVPINTKGEMRRATHRGLDRAGLQKPVGDRAPRFGKSENATPGPGHYNTGNSLLKRTFNITIGYSWE